MNKFLSRPCVLHFKKKKILSYHVYSLVPLLCSGEADDFSRFSLLSCFHGLLDRNTREEAEVRAELMK